MIQYIIQDSEAGNIITKCDSLKEALELVETYENIDKLEGNFKPNFYEITINSKITI